jgi:hypothetical protein
MVGLRGPPCQFLPDLSLRVRIPPAGLDEAANIERNGRLEQTRLRGL